MNVTYQMDVVSPDGKTKSKNGHVQDDQFGKLAGNGLAEVATSYHFGLDYSKEKVVVTITCTCNQDEASINEAGKLTFMKAVELVGDNWSLLDHAKEQQQKR